MKKNVIAVLLSAVLAATAPVLAAEATAQETVTLQLEESTEGEEEASEIMEELDSGLTDEGIIEEEKTQHEEESVQVNVETEDEAVLDDEHEETVDTAVATELAEVDEEEVTESVDDGGSTAEITEKEESPVIEEEILTADENETTLAEDVVDSGTCGDNVTWMLTGAENSLTLTISGTGAVENYTYEQISEDDEPSGYLPPWFSKRNRIKYAVIEEGTTHIEIIFLLVVEI